MRLNKKQLKDSRLYLILDQAVCGNRPVDQVLRQALQGGVDIVQYRDKESSTKSMIQRAARLHRLAKKYGVPFLINDRLDVAIACDAEGIHLGQDDMPAQLCRRILGPRKIIGLSCHSSREIKQAQNNNVDYLAFGPIFPTSLKTHLRPRGLKVLKKLAPKTRRPLFAVGGIEKSNIGQIVALSNVGAAVCREICQSKNPLKAARYLKDRFNEETCTKH